MTVSGSTLFYTACCMLASRTCLIMLHSNGIMLIMSSTLLIRASSTLVLGGQYPTVHPHTPSSLPSPIL